MGRKPSRNPNLPAGMRVRHRKYGVYYYLDTGETPRKEIPLGTDYPEAVKKWAELTVSGKPQHLELITFRYVAERYMREVLPTKAPATQKDNLRELKKIYEFFDNPPAPLNKIEPIHIRQYMDWRSPTAKIRANREKALFSHIWNFARERGLTNKSNPCEGVKGFKEKGRDVYTEQNVFKAVYDAADRPTRDCMDLAYLSAQRPSDVISFSRADVRDNVLYISQGKTKKKLRLELIGELGVLINKLLKQKPEKPGVQSLTLIFNENGQSITYWALYDRFKKARDAAAKIADEAGNVELAAAVRNFQFRDLRAKAGTDKTDSSGIHAAQKLLGHSKIAMTEHYVKNRAGDVVKPTK